ncbi:hypothetical protein LCGC14_1413350 [marine sediment metagenome]|uniref:Uncharacterized protein n=1 Tax=marine sediment metagenome TaxID=412755 RepID=A0A0F9JTX9_9ZZZZ|nr:hypothetical protein [Candidatus Aminicenantes bacterium]
MDLSKDLNNRKHQIIKMGQSSGWEYGALDNNIHMISFFKKIDGAEARIDVSYSTMTVSSSLNHPKQGKTQLNRKEVTAGLMLKIFQDPRTHTSHGYKTKKWEGRNRKK